MDPENKTEIPAPAELNDAPPVETPPEAEAAPAAEAEPVVEPAAEAVSTTESEVEKIRADYESQLEKLKAKLQVVETEKIAMIRAAGIKSVCEKSGYPELAGVFDGATEIDEEFAKRMCKFMSDNAAKVSATASAITPDGESTEDLEDVPLAQMSVDQIRQKYGTKK